MVEIDATIAEILEATKLLEGTRPVDAVEAHSGLFLSIDRASAAAAAAAFQEWPQYRRTLTEVDVAGIPWTLRGAGWMRKTGGILMLTYFVAVTALVVGWLTGVSDLPLFVPIFAPLIAGLWVAIIPRGIHAVRHPLPEWSRWEWLKNVFFLCVACISAVAALPIVIAIDDFDTDEPPTPVPTIFFPSTTRPPLTPIPIPTFSPRPTLDPLRPPTMPTIWPPVLLTFPPTTTICIPTATGPAPTTGC
jgi:hypothetical protein